MGGTALKTGGADVPTMMAALFGTLMLASCTEMVLSRILHLARRIITPLVSGVVVMIIGLSADSGGANLHRRRLCRHERQHLWRTEKPAAGRRRPGHYYPAESAA